MEKTDLSVLSGIFGIAKFLKNGPYNLVPRDSYGCEFFTILVIVLTSLISKTVSLSFVLAYFVNPVNKIESPTLGVFVSICFFVIPNIIFVSRYI